MFSIIIFIIVFSYYKIRLLINPNYVIRFSKYILLFLPFLFLFITLYYGINAEEYPILDILLSGRLSFYKELLTSFTLYNLLFGMTLDEEAIIDSAYLQMIIQVGISFLVYFLWLYFHSIKNIIRQQNILLITFVFSVLSYALMESFITSSFVMCGCLFWIILLKYRYGTDPFFDKVVEEDEDKEIEVSDYLKEEDNTFA